ncbi:YciI family protein [Microbulbifer halophilus]|uniref:YciI family protein n=1 Tax=Microbulbifer halophilus TaxID=453963 RepID=A0ABW5EBW5_9GAMM|nr:YciI family protein [Microbulbifer halophilus]MCW8126168.1 YciI family protein [Microbulbifer halophilus]
MRDGEVAILRRLDAKVVPGAKPVNGDTTMKYLCLVYSDEDRLHSQPDSPGDSECQAYAESVAGSGRMLAAEALQPVDTATTVRMRGGEMTITDGPFAETKEQLAGFYLVDAHNLDEALEIAADIPAARVGSVEVRPVRELQV